MRRLRVLLIAEAANPEWTSVPLVGWSQARAISEVTDAHIVTQVRNREAFLRAGLREGEDFTSINSEAVAARIYRLASLLRGGAGKGWTTITAFSGLSYYYFEHLLWRKMGARIRRKEFDVVHRITPLSPTIPSLLARRCRDAGVPFVLGPLNGGVPWPKGFDGARRREREWLSYLRSVYKLMPGYWSTRRDASAILIASQDTWAQMPRTYHQKCRYMPENGIDPNRFREQRTRTARVPIRVIFVGRLVPYKGLDMLLEAAAPLLRAGKITLDVIGDGPQRSELVALASQLGLEDHVDFQGWVDHKDLQKHLAGADVLGFPSIREFGGGVVLEAMAMGVVPVIVDYGGPAELVTNETGYAVPIGSRQQIIEGFRRVLDNLLREPGQIEARSAKAVQRVSEAFTWQAKAQELLRVYQSLISARSVSSDPGEANFCSTRAARNATGGSAGLSTLTHSALVEVDS